MCVISVEGVDISGTIALVASSRPAQYTISARGFSGMTMVATKGRETMQVKRLSEHAVMPVRGSEHAAGFDLASAYDATVPAGRQALIKTDLSIAIPPNTYARIAPRSGLAVRKMIDVGAGVVDYDYRGPVGVVLFNHGPDDFIVKRGDRVAQLILERICMADVEEVTSLSETTRGAGGFGSTGVGDALKSSAEHNIPKKPKISDEAGQTRYLLEQIDRALDELSLAHDSDLSLELRKRAMIAPKLLETQLEGAMERFTETANKKALLQNLKAMTG